MLTNLTLENFKAFQKLDDLKIKPITILCGTNSCGKSSILQSILLLKQTFESQNLKQDLLLNGRFVKLGYAQDIIYKKKDQHTLSFEFSFELLGKEMMSTFFAIAMPGIVLIDIDENINYQIRYRASFLSQKDDILEGQEILKPLSIEQIKLTIVKKGNQIENNAAIILLEREGDNKYQLTGKPEQGNYLDFGIVEGASSGFFHKIYLNQHVNDGSAFVSLYSLSAANVLINEILGAFSYIGPLREEPAKRYIYEDEVLEIGNKGENAAYLYFTEKNKKINNHYFFNKSISDFEKQYDQTLHSALQKWFDLMKIPNFEAEINNKIIYLNMEASTHDQTRVGIADVGFGVSQIFPIILEGLRMKKGSTLMLEQPEIHLHPNLQMQMADYFISLALSGKRVLVETHSDHVINRLVRRIVEDETHNLQDLIGIYFIKPSENGSVYEEVKIDETKGIINWPPDFFDQTANEQMKIMQAGLKKRKNQRAVANGKNS